MPVALDAAPDRESLDPRAPQAKLSLVEGLLAEEASRACPMLPLRWLARHAGIEHGLCAVVDSDLSRLTGLIGLGLSLDEEEAGILDLGERTRPLALALVAAEPVAFHGSGKGRRGALDTPLGSDSFHA